MDKALLRNIPKVDELLAPVRALCPNASTAAVTAAVRRTLDALREDILSGAARELPERDVLCALAADAARRRVPACDALAEDRQIRSSTQPASCSIRISAAPA